MPIIFLLIISLLIKIFRVPNYEAACITAGGKWESQPAFGIPAPDCKLADFSRDNHLGNTLSMIINNRLIINN